MLYFFENFVLDPGRRELRRGNALVAVQPQVFDPAGISDYPAQPRRQQG